MLTETHYLVAEQLEGLEKDITQSILTDTIEDAEDFFVDAKERLLDVNNWKRYGGAGMPEFSLCDHHGNPIKRRAHKSDYIKVSPFGNVDFNERTPVWVVIEAIEYDDYPDLNSESFAIRLRQSMPPVYNSNRSLDMHAHQTATSTLVIERTGKKLAATYHSRNDMAEIAVGMYVDEQSIKTNAGCWMEISDVQCTNLLKGFIR